MRLLSLELENWAVHSKLAIPLENSLQIEGRNGTGKSSILDAIRFVFSKDSRNYKNKIKNGTRSCTVRLAFEDSGNEYMAEKKIHLSRASTAQLSMNSNIIASNPTEVYNRLQDILSESVLDKLLYVPQDGLVDLIENLRVKGGRKELDLLLSLDRFERVYKGVTDELKEEKARFDELSSRLFSFGEDAEEKYEKEIKDVKGENRKLECAIKEGNSKKTALSHTLQDLEKDVECMRKTKKEKQELEKKINGLEIELAGMRKELEGLEKNIGVLQEQKKRHQSLHAEREKLERYVLLKEPLQRLKGFGEKLEGLGEVGDLESKASVLEKELSGRDKIETEFSGLEEAVRKAEKHIAAREQSLGELKEYIESLGELSDKANCPRCGQKLTRDHVEKERNKSSAMIEKLEKEISESSVKLRKTRDDLALKKNTLEELDKKDLVLQRLREEIRNRKTEKEKIIEVMDSIRKELDGLGYRDEPIKEVEKHVSRLSEINGKLEDLDKAIHAEGECKKRLEGLNRSIEKLESGKTSLQKKTVALEYDEGLLEGLQQEIDRLREGAYRIDNSISEKRLRVEYNLKSIEELNSKIDELRKLSERGRELRVSIGLLSEAQEIFHTNKGIVKYLRERYISQLSNQMSYYFRRINQNPKYREIVFDKDYNINIKTTEGDFSFDQLSGGERVQLAIALRIALIRMLSPIRLMILDEPFGSLDKEHREVLGSALNKIAADGQLILVTHVTVDSLDLPGRLELGGY